MDPELKEAARDGDVEFLRKAFATQPAEYFLTQVPAEDDSWVGENILHLAAWADRLDFIKEAVKILPKDTLKQLLFQSSDESNRLPLHAAAVKSDVSHRIVLIFKQLYSSFNLSYQDGLVKPWSAVTHEKKMTALHLALDGSNANENCALEILKMDGEFVSCTMVDSDGNTPLYYALSNGFNEVAEMILTSPLASSSPASLFRSSDKSTTPFQLATADDDYYSEVIMRLLFKHCGEWLDEKIDENGFTIIHQWVENEDARPFNLLEKGDDLNEARTKVFKQNISEKDTNDDTPLHIAARYKDSEVGMILLRGHKQQQLLNVENPEIGPMECPPWRIKNKTGNTPIHVALIEDSKHEKLALEMLAIDSSVSKILNNKGESLFFLAVHSGCAVAVDEIMNIEEPSFQMLRRNDGTTVLHGLSSCPEKIGKRLLGKYWWLMNVRDDSKNTPLDNAKEKNAFWLIDLLNHPSHIQKEEFNWIEACELEETIAIFGFIDSCQDLQQTCRQQNDTPLHHIKLPSYKEYLTFLKIPAIAELKNTVDQDGATPLHKALERKDIYFAKALLLDKEVERIIPDHSGKTSMDLLAELCKANDNWQEMCKQIKVNPYLRTSYIQPGANLDQIRNTLSVVAALLATITFAAGFTLPGGLNDDTGEAKFGKRVGFLVFLLADVYAMCTSMLVLFCLIWSMVSEPDMARLLVDRSVFLLLNSLYGTLLAFMAGIYTMIKHSSLWAAIVIFVMCSVIGVSANRTILNKLIVRLVPAARNRDKPADEIRLLEEGHGASTLRKDISGNTE